MSRFPELLQFRAPPGTSIAIEEVAKAEGKRPAEIVREAVAARLAAATASVTAHAA
ncbi:hypothetical protein [Jiella sonneratiae]|uniref:Ribbon-helix-helix protein CopG domain-containing protein n=1 Tax=Jiella sonneratiae TaxID=2816856 RepID=A0ABS3J2A7_9HYPH|nr:hypothetical protein [Jiella sonneratiae]MBO0903804.1 hypothetical protein [Jiella sonneratiae]